MSNSSSNSNSNNRHAEVNPSDSAEEQIDLPEHVQALAAEIAALKSKVSSCLLVLLGPDKIDLSSLALLSLKMKMTAAALRC